MKMFNNFSHQGNANQKYTEIFPHPNQNGNQKTKQQMLAWMWGKEKPLFTAGGDVN
jgi:hypothetical protein